MEYSWKNLRSFQNSRNSAFEELCCQLAFNEEDVPKGSNFERKGIPDAGVECYWTLPSNNEWGWQAKFFETIPSIVQWNEIDDSVKTALSKHPNLTRYYICLPLDKPDARIQNQKSFAKKWKDRIEKWNKWALNKKMKVKFIFWGNHQIFERLSKDIHRGRRFFWFNEEYFTNDWYEEKLDEAIIYAGPRYTPQLNVTLEISKVFEGFGRTDSLFRKYEGLFGNVKIKYDDINNKELVLKFKNEYDELRNKIHQILFFKNDFLERGNAQYKIEELRRNIQSCVDFLWDLESLLRKYDKENPSNDPVKREGIFSYTRSKLEGLSSSLAELNNFLESDCAIVSNYNNLLITGEAGIGKTHLLCDLANTRVGIINQPLY